jgi:hypothetical protein
MKDYTIAELAHTDHFFHAEEDRPIPFLEVIEEKILNIPNINEKLTFLDEVEFAVKKYVLYITDAIGSAEIDYDAINMKYDVINLLKEELEHKLNESSIYIPKFQLSKKKGAKIDLIRVLNALYELRLINDSDGQIPSKKIFFNAVGKFIGVELSNYHSNLSQALQNQPLEVNLKVFDEMMEITKKAHYQT